MFKKNESSRFLLFFVLPVLIVLFFVFVKGGGETVSAAARPRQWETMFKRQADFEHDTHSIMLKFLPKTPKSVKDDIVKMLGGSYKDENGDGIDDRYRHIAGGCWMKVTMDKKNRNVDEDAAFGGLSMLQGNSNISFAHFNFKVRTTAIPNDPRFDELWAMNQSNNCDIDAPEAWDITTGSPNVVVGVIDTGINYNHEDLAANVWNNPNEIAGNGIDDDGNGYVDDVHGINAINGTGDPMDDHETAKEKGHGSHCAGIIGAVGGNGIGVTGVNWHVKLIGMKFLDSHGSGFPSAAMECINYALDLKIEKGINLRVLNNSYGGDPFSQDMLDAIKDLNAAGILFVAAAGNDSLNTDTTLQYPSCYVSPNMLSVAATNEIDALAPYSNYGATTVDMGAPGGNGLGGNNIISTSLENGYYSLAGTSQAAPHVAGAAALLLSKNNALTVTDLKYYLMNYGDSISALAGKCVSGKRLNLKKSLDALMSSGVPDKPVLNSPANNVTLATTTPTFKWTAVTASPPVDYYQVQINYNSSAVYVSGNITATSFTVPSGKLAFGKTYNWFVRAHNASGWSSWSGRTMTLVNGAIPTAPVLVSPANNAKVTTGTPTLTWNAVAATPAVDYYQVRIKNNGSQYYLSGNITGTSHKVPINYSLQPEETYQWSVRAYNVFGWSDWSAERTCSLKPDKPDPPEQ